jgi:uncharacterized protein
MIVKTILWLAIALSVPVHAEVAVPPLTGHVIDQTATLSITEQVGLEQTLKEFEAKKGSQVALLIVPTTQPETIEQYSLRVAESWKLGRQKIDDGVILLVAKNDRSLRIEVGYGLEGALNDATAKRIISEVITPYFRQGDFNGGVRAGISSILKVIEGEPLPEKTQAPQQAVKNGLQDYFPVLLIVALAVGGLLRAILGRVAGSFVTGGIIAVIVWFILGAITVSLFAGIVALLFTLFGGSALGRGILLGGGGRGGGFGGGGFSGGGGGFGGGGASGKW